MNRVEFDPSQIHEMRLARFLGFRQRVESPNGFDVFDGLLHIAVDHEGAHEKPVAKGTRANHEVAFGNVALVTRWQEQVLAALPWSGPVWPTSVTQRK